MASRPKHLVGRADKVACGIRPGLDERILVKRFSQLAGMLGRKTAMDILDKKGTGDLIREAQRNLLAEAR